LTFILPFTETWELRNQTTRGLTGSHQHAGKFNVKCLIIVNESPWQSALSLCALRFARASEGSGIQLAAVFFREDGVYNALGGTLADAGTPELSAAWRELAARCGTKLLLCSSSFQRRLPAGSDIRDFQQSGLAEMLEWVRTSDRVITF
jgi:sulfur relay protein TusD/DsrE